MNPQDKALETIRRLLRLGTSSNEHEARSALAKAAELARRHSIDLGCVRADEERARIAERTFESRYIFDTVEKAAVQLCMALFHVRCIFTAQDATFIGMEHNVEAAFFARSFVLEQCGRDLKAFKRERWRTLRKRTAEGAAQKYCLGWVLGVQRRYELELKEVEPEAQLENSKSAIILREQDKEVAAYMDEKHADAGAEKKRRFRKHTDALLTGFNDGQKVSIRTPIKEGQREPAPALPERSAA